MANARKITYVSVQTNLPQSVVSTADTWGQLKTEFPDIGARAQGMKAYVRETNMDLVSDNQTLPSSDFTIYLLIEKNKSGNKKDPRVTALIDRFLDEVTVA